MKLELLQKLENKNWEQIINDPNQLKMVQPLNTLAAIDLTQVDKVELEKILINVEVYQKHLNKYEKENIKPIKDTLNSYRDIVIKYEKSTTGLAKNLRKAIKDRITELEAEVSIIQELETIKEHVCKCGVCGKGIK